MIKIIKVVEKERRLYAIVNNEEMIPISKENSDSVEGFNLFLEDINSLGRDFFYKILKELIEFKIESENNYYTLPYSNFPEYTLIHSINDDGTTDYGTSELDEGNIEIIKMLINLVYNSNEYIGEDFQKYMDHLFYDPLF